MKTKEVPITSGAHIGLPIDELIRKIEQAKPIMMSDREFKYILSRVDELKKAIEKVRRWGL